MESQKNVAPSEQTARAVSAAMDEPDALVSFAPSQDQRVVQQTWQRYHLIGDALRNELPPQTDPAFSERVACALAAEPAYTSARDIASTNKTSWLTPLLSWLSRPLAQAAVAGSVAVCAIVSVQMLNQQPETGGSLSVLPTTPMAPAAPVSLELSPEQSGIKPVVLPAAPDKVSDDSSDELSDELKAGE